MSKTIVKDLKVLAKTNFLSLYNADYINKGGKEKTWTIATRKSKEALEEQFFQGKEDKMDAVVILAYHKEEKKLVAIKQFRVPLNNYVYELPAGLIDNNDDIISTVERELKEETGIKNVKVLNNNIFSLEIICVNGHIKKEKYVSSHQHLNLTYLVEVDEKEILKVKEEENSGVKWMNLEDIAKNSNEKWMIENVYQKLNDKLKNTRYVKNN